MDCPCQLSSLTLNKFRQIRFKHMTLGTFPKRFNSFILHVRIVLCCCVLSTVTCKVGYSVETFDGIFPNLL